MPWTHRLRILLYLTLLYCQILDAIFVVIGYAELSAFTAEEEEEEEVQVQEIPATSEFCATTKASFQNVNFDYTWRIVGLMRHMAYLKKFRNEFQIKYESFKILGDKFSGEWSICLRRDNLTLEYVTTDKYEAPTNFVCVLELVVGTQSNVYEFRKGVNYEEKVDSPVQMRNPQEGNDKNDENADAHGKDGDDSGLAGTTVVKKYSAIYWPYFGESVLDFIESPKEGIDTIEIVFHMQAFLSGRQYTVPTCFSE